MILISIPAAVLSVASYKRTPYIKALAVIFIGAAVVGGASFYIFGLATPKASSSQTSGGGNTTTSGPTATQPPPNLSQTIKVSILPGASAQGNPNYDPKTLSVKKGVGIQWSNNDNVPHTVTSYKDAGKSFDSSIIISKGNFTLDTTKLGEKEYDYFCTLHPFMRAKFTIDGGAAAAGATADKSSTSTASNSSKS
jgi:plastocyanin